MYGKGFPNKISRRNRNMRIENFSLSNSQNGGMNRKMATDSVSKNIQNQIANAQKQLQELSANENMSAEEKMKKRQEIQQQITDLNNQLRQHQIEQKKSSKSKVLLMIIWLVVTKKEIKVQAYHNQV